MRTPPGPKSLSSVGALRRLRGDALEYLEQVRAEYGDAAIFRMGPRKAYLLSHPDAVREVLVGQQQKFMKGPALERSKDLLGEGLLTSEGEHHLRQRRLVQPAFHRQRIAGYAEAMVSLAERWSDSLIDGERIDIANEMKRLTLSIVGRTLFDVDVESEADEVGSALTTLLEQFDRLVDPLAPLWKLLPLESTRSSRLALVTLNRIVYRMIGERRAELERSPEADRGDLLSMMVRSRDEDGSRMDDRQLRDETMTLLIAGHETTANVIAWTWYLLGSNPVARERLERELERVLQGRPPRFEDIPLLETAGMIVRESMRLYPPAWLVGRRALEDVKIGEWLIPRGSLVAVSQWIVHRDERWWPEPLRFDLDRWSAEEIAKRPKFSYFPFSAGTRMCIGDQFAMTEATLLLAAIARRWRFELEPGHRVEPLPVLTLRPRNGIRVAVRARGTPREGRPGSDSQATTAG